MQRYWLQVLHAATQTLAEVVHEPWHMALLTALGDGPGERIDVCVSAIGLVDGQLPDYDLRWALDEFVDCGWAIRCAGDVGGEETYELTAAGRQRLRRFETAAELVNAAHVHRAAFAPRWHRLTARERQAARLVARGYADRDVATTMRISVRTARNLVGRVLEQLDLRSRGQLIAFVIVAAPTA